MIKPAGQETNYQQKASPKIGEISYPMDGKISLTASLRLFIETVLRKFPKITDRFGFIF